jgi:hypothetical protein
MLRSLDSARVPRAGVGVAAKQTAPSLWPAANSENLGEVCDREEALARGVRYPEAATKIASVCSTFFEISN